MSSEFDEIDEQIRKLIADTMKIDKSEVRKESTIAELGGDSLAVLELLSVLENHFNISIPNEEALEITSFKAISKAVRKHIKS